jgi:hypothetical protein
MKTHPIAELPEDQRRLLLALIEHWFQSNPAGMEIMRREGLSLDAAVTSMCDLHDRGLVRFITSKVRRGRIPFRIELVLPLGRGGRA